MNVAPSPNERVERGVLALVGGSILLLGGGAIALIASGVFSSRPTAEQAANRQTPNNPPANPATNNQASNTPQANPAAAKPATAREQLLGNWQGQEMDAGNVEFRRDGSLSLTMGGASAKGSYKFLDDQTVEVRLELGGQIATQKLRIQVDRDSLTTTDEMNKVEHFHRATAVASRPPEQARPPQPSPPSPGEPAASLTAEQLAAEYQQGINALALSKNGKLLASAGRDREIFLWDVAAGK